jgi:hypothetical protein
MLVDRERLIILANRGKRIKWYFSSREVGIGSRSQEVSAHREISLKTSSAEADVK